MERFLTGQEPPKSHILPDNHRNRVLPSLLCKPEVADSIRAGSTEAKNDLPLSTGCAKPFRRLLWLHRSSRLVSIK